MISEEFENQGGVSIFVTERYERNTAWIVGLGSTANYDRFTVVTSPPSFRLNRLEYPIVRQGIFENISL